MTKITSPVNYSSTSDIYNVSEQIDFCMSILRKAKPGDRHLARLRAGKYAGCLIVRGLVDQSKITDILLQVSDSISDGGITSDMEKETILSSIGHGKRNPHLLHIIQYLMKRSR